MVCALQSSRAPLLKTEYLKPKLKTVSTKLSELPQTTTYHTITYKASTGPCPLHRTEVRKLTRALPSASDRSPETASDRSPKLTASDRSPETDWDLVPCIGPKFGTNYIGSKSGTEWDHVPCIGPKSGN